MLLITSEIKISPWQLEGEYASAQKTNTFKATLVIAPDPARVLQAARARAGAARRGVGCGWGFAVGVIDY
jgi:hypothetical protein